MFVHNHVIDRFFFLATYCTLKQGFISRYIGIYALKSVDFSQKRLEK